METKGQRAPSYEELSSHWTVAVGVESIWRLWQSTKKLTVGFIMTLHEVCNFDGNWIQFIEYTQLHNLPASQERYEYDGDPECERGMTLF